MAVVVSDTSPIRSLDHLSRLDLLDALFGEVVVPPAVSDELAHPRPRFRPVLVSSLPFARVQAPSDQVDVANLRRSLGPGESEAIVLAAEIGAELLIDESAGRAEARRRGLRRVGVLGILVRAKQRGQLPIVLPLMERLRDELGFFVSAELYDEVRRQAGE